MLLCLSGQVALISNADNFDKLRQETMLMEVGRSAATVSLNSCFMRSPATMTSELRHVPRQTSLKPQGRFAHINSQMAGRKFGDQLPMQVATCNLKLAVCASCRKFGWQHLVLPGGGVPHAFWPRLRLSLALSCHRIVGSRTLQKERFPK